MLWLVSDPRVGGQEMVLALPRVQPVDEEALARWLNHARKASRVEHPGLARAVEVGQHDHWPYVSYDRGSTVTLQERLGRNGLPAAELVPTLLTALQGLAFAHDAGIAHQDLHLAMFLVSEGGAGSVMGLGVAGDLGNGGSELQDRRKATERDLLCFGLALHHGLCGSPALGQSDLVLAAQQMAPLGRDVVRLPRAGGQSIAEPLRAIVDRATDRQERQRYRSARTLERALAGWLKCDGEGGEGPLVLLIDRMRSAGLLPGMPGCSARASRLIGMDRKSMAELAEVVLADVGLSFEMLRNVNGGRMRGALGGGNGAILTVRRAITMLGLNGVRRASQVLKPWPGALADAHVPQLAALLERVLMAGRVAQWLRPAGYDAELVYVLAMLQSLGRLLVQYHFPEEAAQIRRLMQPESPLLAGEPDEPGMSEEGASYAVLGVDIDALGVAVGRYWGLDDSAQLMMRRTPLALPIHEPENDRDTLRLTASCANEVVDARHGPARGRAAELQRVAQRYGQALGITLKEVQQAALGQAPDEPSKPGATRKAVGVVEGTDSEAVAPAGTA